MKRTLDRLNQAEKTAALVNACSVSIEQAVTVALMGIGGTVIDAKLKEKDEQVVWRIKLLTAGGPVKMYIDGCSGRILETKHEKPLTAHDGMVIPEEVVAGPGSHEATDVDWTTEQESLCVCRTLGTLDACRRGAA